jgi:hypothetical protein
VNLLLNRQQVDERLVDRAVRAMAFVREQAAESVLHGAGGRRIDMALRSRKMNDILADEIVGDA